MNEEGTRAVFPLPKSAADTIEGQVQLMVALGRPEAYDKLLALGCTALELRAHTGRRLRLAAMRGGQPLRLCDVADDEEEVGKLGFDRQVDTDELTFVLDWVGPIYDDSGQLLEETRP